jgi:protein TonB
MKSEIFIKVMLLLSILVLGACSTKVLKKDDVIREMITIVGISPYYPKAAALDKIEGSVTVEFLVTKKGIVKDPVIISSNPIGVFDKEVIRAILKYKFLPRSINNEMVEARASLNFHFKLDS